MSDPYHNLPREFREEAHKRGIQAVKQDLRHSQASREDVAVVQGRIEELEEVLFSQHGNVLGPCHKLHEHLMPEYLGRVSLAAQIRKQAATQRSSAGTIACILATLAIILGALGIIF